MTEAVSSALLLNEAVSGDQASTDGENAAVSAGGRVAPAITLGEYPLLQERLIAYLNVVGIKDAAQANAIAVDALARARRKVAPGLHEELFRRTLEDIQRQLDLALTKSLGLGLTSDTRAVSGARAALLMGRGISADVLLGAGAQQALDVEALRNELPQATPPETPLPMVEQQFSFFFGPSPLSNSK